MRSSPAHGRVRAWFAAALAGLVWLGSGCARGVPAEPAAGRQPMLEVFARERFYEERAEPEEVLHGILRAVPVREGPNTRSLPFALATPDGDYGVYVSGVDEASLQPFVDREVTVRGKLIDQSAEGYGVEVWMASITVRTE